MMRFVVHTNFTHLRMLGLKMWELDFFYVCVCVCVPALQKFWFFTPTKGVW